MITIDDVKKIDLRIAKVLEVNDHPNADKLLVLTIGIGEERRQIVAGIKMSYTPEQLIGKNIVMIANLEPVILRGVESQGMLLAAKDDAGLTILTTDKEIASGSKVS